MISRAFFNFKGAEDLLDEEQAGHLVGEGHGGEAKCRGGDGSFGESFSAANGKCKGGAAFFDGFKEIGGKSFACEGFACGIQIDTVFFFA